MQHLIQIETYGDGLHFAYNHTNLGSLYSNSRQILEIPRLRRLLQMLSKTYDVPSSPPQKKKQKQKQKQLDCYGSWIFL